MFNTLKRSRFHNSVTKRLRKTEKTRETPEWKLTTCAAIDGLLGVGFLRNDAIEQDKVLIVGNAGQTLLDCTTGEQLHRNREDDGFDVETLTAFDLRQNGCPLPVQMAGLYGGGLHTVTDDGWTVEAIAADWPIHYYILNRPGHSIYLDAKLGDDTQFYLFEKDYENRAWGFSPSGNSLIYACSSDVTIWSRHRS